MKVNFRVDPKHAIKRRLEINLTLDPASVFVDPPNWLILLFDNLLKQLWTAR